MRAIFVDHPSVPFTSVFIYLPDIDLILCCSTLRQSGQMLTHEVTSEQARAVLKRYHFHPET